MTTRGVWWGVLADRISSLQERPPSPPRRTPETNTGNPKNTPSTTPNDVTKSTTHNSKQQLHDNAWCLVGCAGRQEQLAEGAPSAPHSHRTPQTNAWDPKNSLALAQHIAERPDTASFKTKNPYDAAWCLVGRAGRQDQLAEGAPSFPPPTAHHRPTLRTPSSKLLTTAC